MNKYRVILPKEKDTDLVCLVSNLIRGFSLAASVFNKFSVYRKSAGSYFTDNNIYCEIQTDSPRLILILVKELSNYNVKVIDLNVQESVEEYQKDWVGLD